MKKYIVLFVLILTVLSCSSGYKAYKKGDYYKATIESIEKLRNSPNSEKAQYVLVKSYPLAVKAALRDADRALASNNTNSYDEVVYQYSRITDMANAIYNSPKAYSIFPQPVEYPAELTDAKIKAADQAYTQGLKALNTGNVQQARLALNYFNKANNYVPGYKDVLNLMEDAKFNATLRVIFEKPLINRRYQLSADFFSDNLLGELSGYTNNKFVRFYRAEDAGQMMNYRPHQYLVLNFEDFSIGNLKESSNTVEYTKDSVVTGTKNVEGKKVNIYSTVKCKLTTYKQQIRSNGILSVRIYDAQTNAILQQRNFSGEYVWETAWGRYNGDERALTKEQVNFCNVTPKTGPNDQDLFIEFTKPIYSQTISFLKSVYK